MTVPSIVISAARDYDIPLYIVQAIYEKWYDKGLFYEKLEDYLKTKLY